MTDGGTEPKSIPQLAELVNHLKIRSRGLSPVLQPPGADLVAEVAARDYEVSEEEAAWLRNADVWPGAVTGQLLEIIRLLEGLGVRHAIRFTHVGDETPAEIVAVTIKLRGD